MKFTVILFLLIFLAVLNSFGQVAPSTINFDEQTLLNDLKIISGDNMNGRETNTPGHKNAMNYVIKRFRESGLKRFTNSYESSFYFTDKKDSAHSLYQGTNIIGYLKGKIEPEKFIVIIG